MSKLKVTEEEFIEQWELTRKRGFLRYILVQGGLSWGIFSGVIYIFLLFVGKNFIDLPPEGSLMMNKFFQMGLFIIFGIFLGAVIWYRNEKRYLKRKPYNKKK